MLLLQSLLMGITAVIYIFVNIILFAFLRVFTLYLYNSNDLTARWVVPPYC